MRLRNQVRPLGPLAWVCKGLDTSASWSTIGSISPEDRCLAASIEFRQLCPNACTTLIRLEPEHLPTHRQWLSKSVARIEKNSKHAVSASFTVSEPMSFLAVGDVIAEYAFDFADNCEKQVLLDVSTMPKRYFFPLLTALCESKRVETLLVTNTSPQTYGKVLSENASEWETLPGFASLSSHDSQDTTVMIGVGYQLLNLRELLERYGNMSVSFKLMLPVPSPHPGFIDNWKFIEGIDYQFPSRPAGDTNREPEIVRFPNQDVSLAFDRLVQHSRQGEAPCLVMAPFGPKPLSVAMCLLGIARQATGFDTEIGYTQPSAYSPDYSSGIGDVTAFCIKLNGRNLYSL